MPYIERDRDGEFFCSASQTVEINPSTGTPVVTNRDENLERWKWLINGWATMTFKERMSLFTPYVQILRLYNSTPVDFDDAINDHIIDTSYDTCRKFNSLKYDEDHHGSPCFTLIYDPIDPDCIPDAATRSAVKMWGSEFGFYKSNTNTATSSTCPCNK